MWKLEISTQPLRRERSITGRQPSVTLGVTKRTTVKPRGRRRDLYGLLLHQGGHCIRQSQPPDGIGAGSWEGGSENEREGVANEKGPDTHS